jgi:hypothetical protein
MKDKFLTVLLVCALMALLVVLMLIQPTMEAITFNKFTDGPKATVVDAMFGNLRITK